MKILPYILFLEQPDFLFNDFLGAFGGALAFWIGLDCLMFVYLFYSLVELVVRFLFFVWKQCRHHGDNVVECQDNVVEEIAQDMELKSV